MTILSAGLILVTVHRGIGKGHRGYVITEQNFSALSFNVSVDKWNCCVKTKYYLSSKRDYADNEFFDRDRAGRCIYRAYIEDNAVRVTVNKHVNFFRWSRGE